jgi:hypothetical protein
MAFIISHLASKFNAFLRQFAQIPFWIPATRQALEYVETRIQGVDVGGQLC